MLPTKAIEADAAFSSLPLAKAGSHIVLHNLHAVFVLEGNTRYLVKNNAVPEANKPDLLGSHIVKRLATVV